MTGVEAPFFRRPAKGFFKNYIAIVKNKFISFPKFIVIFYNFIPFSKYRVGTDFIDTLYISLFTIILSGIL